MTPTSATPTAFATCCRVDDVPETVPACCGSTETITVPIRPERVTPMPRPPSARPGTSQRTEPPTPISVDGGQQQRVAGAEGERRRDDAGPGTEPAQDAGRVAGAEHVRQRHRREHGARLQRAQAAAVLEVERQHQEVRRHAREQEELAELPGADRTRAHGRDVDERGDPRTAQRGAPETGEDGEHRRHRRG